MKTNPGAGGKNSTKKKPDYHAEKSGKVKSNQRLFTFLIFVISFFLYANTLNFSFVLDDPGIISDNSLTKAGIRYLPEVFSSGYRSTLTFVDNELYRPVAKTLFVIEWQLWGDSPKLFHLVNVLLYAASCCLLFQVLILYLSRGLTIPLLTTVLFLFHPIHTEVVANVKSADELLGFFFILISLLTLHQFIFKKSKLKLILSLVCFFLALLSKESIVVFVLLIPLTIYFFTPITWKENIKLSIGYFFLVVLFIWIRWQVLGNHHDQPGLESNYLVQISDTITQKSTAVFLLGYYVLLLFLPFRLMSDGSFNEFPVVPVSDWRFILPASLFVLMFIYAIINFKRRALFSYSIFFFLISISVVSNIFFLIGTNYGERLLYVPSLAMCLALAVLLLKLTGGEGKANRTKNAPIQGKHRSRLIYCSLVILILYGVKTTSRSSEWKSPLILHAKDVEKAPNSARAHYYLGNLLATEITNVFDSLQRKALASRGREELKKAINIYPDYDEAYYALGEIYSFTGKYDSAAICFRNASLLKPEKARYHNNYGDILFKQGKYFEAKDYFALAVKYDSTYSHALCNLGTSYVYYAKDFAKQADNAILIRDSGTYIMKTSLSEQYYDSAIYLLKKSISLEEGFYLPYYILGIVYQDLGDKKTSDNYFYQSNQRQARDKRLRLKRRSVLFDRE